MDNRKIGKLIAMLRKQKGYTQQDLGDKVGVGFRAVSKWERGLTLPDITIINELSKILGITSDELLSGELKKENKQKNKPKSFSTIIKILIPILILIISTISIITYYNNKTYVYKIIAEDKDNYYVDGKVMLTNDDINIIINKLNFLNESFISTEIENYDYQVLINDELVVGYGYNPVGIKEEETNKINDITESFRINYNGQLEFKIKNIQQSKLKIRINFIKIDSQVINKEIECILTPTEK